MGTPEAKEHPKLSDHLPDVADPRSPLHELLVRAGRVSLDLWQSAQVHTKGDGTPVTDADRAADEILWHGLLGLFPEDAVVSEERPDAGGPEHGKGTWFIDPLDGTRVFTEGLAHWGPTICRVEGGRLTHGGFYQPVLGRMLMVDRDGAWEDGRRLPPLKEELDRYTRTLLVPSGSHRVGPVDWEGRTRNLGSTAAHLWQVARGTAAATIISRWSIWDIGCGLLACEHVGARIVDLSGAPLDPMSSPDTPFIAGHPQAVSLILQALERLASSNTTLVDHG